MTVAREQHLAWCRSRALEILDAGDTAGAIASMLSDVRKWERPIYDETLLSFLALDAMMFASRTPDQMRRWIEGFA